MRRIAYILMVGALVGASLYVLLVVGSLLNAVLPLYILALLIAIGIIAAAIIDFFGPSPE